MHRRSVRTWSAVPVIAVAALSWGCADEGDTIKKDDITGLWRATSVEYVARSGGSRVDLVTQGATATLDLGADGWLDYILSRTGAPPETLRATWQLKGDIGDLMQVTPGGEGWYWMFEVAWSGGILSLTGADARYDCDIDGEREEAKWNMSFVRP